MFRKLVELRCAKCCSSGRSLHHVVRRAKATSALKRTCTLMLVTTRQSARVGLLAKRRETLSFLLDYSSKRTSGHKIRRQRPPERQRIVGECDVLQNVRDAWPWSGAPPGPLYRQSIALLLAALFCASHCEVKGEITLAQSHCTIG